MSINKLAQTCCSMLVGVVEEIIEKINRFFYDNFLLLIILLIGVLTFKNYGIGWDSPIQAKYGELTLEYFKSAFSDKRVLSLYDLKFYTPLFDLIHAVLTQKIPEYKYQCQHFLIFLTGFLTLVAVKKIARIPNVKYLPLISIMFLVSHPRFYGHMFVNPKDIPFACLFSIFMLFLFRLVFFSGYEWKHVLMSSVFFGLTLAVRPAAVPLLFVYSVLFVGASLFFRKELVKKFADLKSSILVFIKIMTMPVIGWIIMVAFWPWAHQDVLNNPVKAIKMAKSFHYVLPVLFEGKYLMSNKMPWYYLIKMIFLTTPSCTIFFFLVGTFFSLKQFLFKRTAIKTYFLLMVHLWYLIPLLVYLIVRPNAYDGIRHYLFILPALSIVAAYGMIMIFENLKNKVFIKGFFFLSLFFFGVNVHILFKFHPYEMTYFNSFFKNYHHTAKNYDTDYWLLSYKEAAEWINGKQEENSHKPLKVLVAGDDLSFDCFKSFLNDKIAMEQIQGEIKGTLFPDYDYYVGTTRFGMDNNFPDSPIVHTVKVDNYPLTIIRKKT